MKAKIKINLDKIVDYTFTDLLLFSITNISSFERWNDAVCHDDDIESLRLSCSSSNKQLLIFQTGSMFADPILTNDEMLDASLFEDYIIVEFEDDAPATYVALMNYFKLGLIDLVDIEEEGKTTIILHRLNDERDHINKNLINVGVLFGNFKAPLGIKDIQIDIENYQIEETYNYVYIPSLKRYYYVVDIQLMNNKFTRLILKEDVLMSWKDLIKLQKAYVTRYGGLSLNILHDDRYPVNDIPTITYIKPTNISTVIQFKLTMDREELTTHTKPNIMLSTFSDNPITVTDNDNVIAPSNSGLPNIQSQRESGSHHYLLNFNDYGIVTACCIKNEAPASYIRSVILYPFDLTDLFPNSGGRGSVLSSGKKVIDVVEGGYGWADYPYSEFAPLFRQTTKGGSPYIVVADFRFGNYVGGVPVNNNFLDRSSNTQWEIYIPFVGWVQIDINTVYGKEVLVYYTVDFDTGISTAYIYSKTDQKVIWSGNCQIGIRLPLVTTNADELARQKQATALNLLMGTLTSAFSIGVGAYSGNALAVVGGAMGLGKTLVSGVNNLNMMIERAQINYGSGDNALYSPMEVIVRKVTHTALLTTQAENDNYYHINGYPYRKYVSISSLSNDKYMEVGEIHFDAKGYDIYSTEIDEIVALLKNGVIL